QLPPAVAKDQKREQSLEGQGRNHTEINGRDRLRVVPEECLPALRRRPTLHHVFRDRRLGDLKAKHQQLRHGSEMLPTSRFPCSSVGSDRATPEPSLAALPASAISNARTP